MMTGYPIVLRLDGRRCLVVGGGQVAVGKVQGLLRAGATVVVVAPEIDAALWEPVDGALVLVRREYEVRDLDGIWLAITCTDDPAVNRAVAADADARGVWVNSADDVENCSFTLPAVARDGDLTVAIATDGRSPALARWAKNRFSEELAHGWSDLLDLLAEVRGELRRETGTSESTGWADALDAGLLDMVRRGEVDAARARLLAALREAEVAA